MSDGLVPQRPVPWRIFISHTSELKQFPEQQSYVDHVVAAIISRGHVPVFMEHFPNRHVTPTEIGRGQLQTCDVFIGIYGFRWGSASSSDPSRSYCEEEYDAAVELGIPCRIFLLDSKSGDLGMSPEELGLRSPDASRQVDFRERLRTRIVEFVTSPQQTETAVISAIDDLEKLYEQFNPPNGTDPTPPVDPDPPGVLPSPPEPIGRKGWLLPLAIALIGLVGVIAVARSLGGDTPEVEPAPSARPAATAALVPTSAPAPTVNPTTPAGKVTATSPTAVPAESSTGASVRAFPQGPAYRVAWASNGLVAAATTGRLVRVWDESGILLDEIDLGDFPADALMDLEWSPEGDRLAVAAKPRHVGIWRLQGADREYRELASDLSPSSLAWSSDGERLVIGAWRRVQVRDMRDGTVVFDREDELDGWGSIAISGDSSRMAGVSGTGLIVEWELDENQQPRRTVFDLGASLWGSSIEYLDDGTLVSAAGVRGADELPLRFWEQGSTTPEFELLLDGRKSVTMSVSASNRFIASAGPGSSPVIVDITDRDAVRLWEFADGRREIFDFAWDPTDDSVAVAAQDGSVSIWSVDPSRAPTCEYELAGSPETPPAPCN